MVCVRAVQRATQRGLDTEPCVVASTLLCCATVQCDRPPLVAHPRISPAPGSLMGTTRRYSSRRIAQTRTRRVTRSGIPASPSALRRSAAGSDGLQTSHDRR
jgi:hypothetical protein